MTPEQTLIAAATKLRELATAANATHPAPWTARPRYPHLDDGRDRAHRLYDTNRRSLLGGAATAGGPFMLAPIARYAALMHPGVGTGLADWLDDAAAGDDHGEHNPYALAVAHQILGDQP